MQKVLDAPRIRFYRLQPVEVVERLAPLLASEAGRLAGSPVTAKVSPGGGWLTLAREETAYRRETALNAVKTPAEAAKHARAFLVEMASRIAGAGAAMGELKSLVPPDSALWESSASPIWCDNGRTIHHWLVTFGIRLKTGLPLLAEADRQAGMPESAVVYGGGIDIRLSGARQILSCKFRWRPYESTGMEDFAVPPEAPVTQPAKNKADEGRLVYLLHDETAAQTILAPFHVLGEDLELMFWPASATSLFAQIAVTDEESSGVAAVVVGGSGEYEYLWASWRVDLPFEDAYSEIGKAISAQLPPGVHNVMLQVSDKSTKAVYQTQRMVFASAAATPPAEPTVLSA